MRPKSIFTWVLAFVGLLIFLTITGFFFFVQETEQVVITQFGQPVGKPITKAGLHVKIPFIQQVHSFDKRVLGWDGPSTEVPTKDKLFIMVDAFGRWRISDPLQFLLRLQDYRRALSRMDDILGSEMRNTIARHELVEAIRTTKGRTPMQDETIEAAQRSGVHNAGTLPNIRYGRAVLEEEITREARAKLAEFGIELLDFRFKRLNYNETVATKIYERMVSERRQIADRFRSEGAGEAARILGQRERDMQQIESEAYRKAQALQGKADAEATAVYAQAYNGSPEARAFYQFQKTLDTYRLSLQKQTTLVLTTDSGFLSLLESGPHQKESPQPAAAPSQPSPPLQLPPATAPAPAPTAPAGSEPPQ